MDFAVTADYGGVDEVDIVADFAVMGDVTAGHEHIVAADFRGSFRQSSGVHGAAFAENVVISDIEIGFRSGDNGMILCRLTESGERMDDIVCTERGVAVDVAVGDQAGVFTDSDIGTHIAEGTDFNAVCKDCTVANDG